MSCARCSTSSLHPGYIQAYILGSQKSKKKTALNINDVNKAYFECFKYIMFICSTHLYSQRCTIFVCCLNENAHSLHTVHALLKNANICMNHNFLCNSNHSLFPIFIESKKMFDNTSFMYCWKWTGSANLILRRKFCAVAN